MSISSMPAILCERSSLINCLTSNPSFLFLLEALDFDLLVFFFLLAMYCKYSAIMFAS